MDVSKEFEKHEVLKYQTNLNVDINRKAMTSKRELRRLEDIIHIQHISPQAETILCIGSRDDSEVVTFIKKGYTAKGIDICTETDLITKMDMSDLTPEFGMFDVVYCSHVLEHVMDPDKTLRAIKSVANDLVFIILPIIDRRPDIEHPTVYEIMKYNPETNFKDFPQAWEDFVSLTPFTLAYKCYRNGITEDYEIAFALKLR